MKLKSVTLLGVDCVNLDRIKQSIEHLKGTYIYWVPFVGPRWEAEPMTKINKFVKIFVCVDC